MATQVKTTDSSETQESPVDFYQTAEHKRVRQSLGMSDTPRELPAWTWVPNEEWRKGQGLLSDHPEHDTTEMKARNRAEEEEHDARKFGWSQKP